MDGAVFNNEVVAQPTLSDRQIDEIARLKMQSWPYSYASQVHWIREKTAPSDRHVMLRRNGALCAYLRLAERRIVAPVGLPVVLGEKDGEAETETPFLIVRIMREGQMDVFATGCYRDKIKPDAAGALRFSQRIVVCDSRRFDTLVAIPF